MQELPFGNSTVPMQRDSLFISLLFRREMQDETEIHSTTWRNRRGASSTVSSARVIGIPVALVQEVTTLMEDVVEANAVGDAVTFPNLLQNISIGTLQDNDPRLAEDDDRASDVTGGTGQQMVILQSMADHERRKKSLIRKWMITGETRTLEPKRLLLPNRWPEMNPQQPRPPLEMMMWI